MDWIVQGLSKVWDGLGRNWKAAKTKMRDWGSKRYELKLFSPLLTHRAWWYIANPRSANQSFWTSAHKKNATCPKTYAMCDANELAGPNITDMLEWAKDMANVDSETCVFLALMAGSPTGLANAFCNKNLNIMCEVFNSHIKWNFIGLYGTILTRKIKVLNFFVKFWFTL